MLIFSFRLYTYYFLSQSIHRAADTISSQVACLFDTTSTDTALRARLYVAGNWNGDNLCCPANGDITIVGDVPSCPAPTNIDEEAVANA